MKTKPLKHQARYMKLSRGAKAFAILGEQGTGKTWMALADAERAYGESLIDGVLIAAPRGVHINWISREIPEHLAAEHIAAFYSAGQGKRAAAKVEKVFAPRLDGDVVPLRILSIGFDALCTDAGFKLATRFLNSCKAMMIVDESQRIKNPRTKRALRVHRLAPFTEMRRICTGTPITKSPGDLFSQFEFLEPGCLGTSSYRAFVTEYAELLPPQHGLMRHIAQRIAMKKGWGMDIDNLSRYQQSVLAQLMPPLVAKDAEGQPIWRNLDKLQELIHPMSYRVLKKDCLDLPKKNYMDLPFELTPEQRRVYDKAHDELRIEFGDDIMILREMTALNKLQQITSGFVINRGEPVLMDIEKNPRMQTFLEYLEDIDGQFIVWAKYREEIRQIAYALKQMKIDTVQYHGGIKPKLREDAVDLFQAKKVRGFIGQPHAGGLGITLTKARTVFRYSRDYNFEDNVQSEDRSHRIGTEEEVLYINLQGFDTIDEAVSKNLQYKADTAYSILDAPFASKVKRPRERAAA